MTPRLKDALLDLQAYGAENGEPWHPALLQALADVTAEQARWRPAPEMNCIWSIVRHVTHWKQGLMRAWDGDGFALDTWRAEDWPELPEDDAAWPRDVEALSRTIRLLSTRVSAADERLLSLELDGLPGPALRHLMNASTHDAYHAGQIRLLLRLQGSA